MEKLVVITGTNASGKSGLGIELAGMYGGEVISADSRQVFKGLDLGSGKLKSNANVVMFFINLHLTILKEGA